MDKLYTIIIAAGKGTRMNSEHTKLVQKIYGKEMIKRVCQTAEEIGSEEIITIVGHKKEEVKKALLDFENILYAEQAEQKGTADAVLKGLPKLEGKDGRAIILYGDVPLIRASTIKDMLEMNIQDKESLTVLTADIENPIGYGRIVRDENGKITKIVEQADLTINEENIKEINAGIYCVDLDTLRETLAEITNDNAQGEYNLPDIVKIAIAKGLNVGTYKLKDMTEILGINDRIQLELVTRVMQMRINIGHMKNGVTIEDRSSTYIHDDVEIGKDTVIGPNTIIKDGVRIGKDCHIGYNCYISENTKIEDGTIIADNTIM